MTPQLWQKRLLKKVEKEGETAGLKLNIKNTKIMASGPFTSWQTDGGNNGNSERLYLFGLTKSLQVTATMKLKDAYSVLASAAHILKDAYSLEGQL